MWDEGYGMRDVGCGMRREGSGMRDVGRAMWDDGMNEVDVLPCWHNLVATVNSIFCHTCLQSILQTSPPTPQKSYTKFWNPRTTIENTPLFPPKYSIVGG